MDAANVPQGVRRVAVLTSGPPMGTRVLHCLGRLGVEADVIDLGVTSNAKYSRFRRKYVRYQPQLAGGNLELGRFLEEYACLQRIDAYIAADIAATARLHDARDSISRALAFPTSSGELLERLDDKWLFQQFMVEHGIPCPRSALLTHPSEVGAIHSSGLQFPLLVKPLQGESSHGIVHARNVDDIERHLRSNSRYARLPLLLQEYVPGLDADVSILAVGGRVLAHVVQARPDPGTLQFIRHERALEVISQVVQESRYSGVANFDLRIHLDDGGVTVLECNPRFWYTLHASMWAGINFVQLGLAAAAGEIIGRPASEGPTEGRYFRHRHLLTNVLVQPSCWRHLRAYNWLGLLQSASDPLPVLYDRIEALRARNRVRRFADLASVG